MSNTTAQVKNTIVNALEEQNLGYYRSTHGVDRAIDSVSESLSAALQSSVENFLDEVGQRNSSLVEEARALFIEVGLLDQPEPVVDPAEVERTETLGKVESMLAEIKGLLAKVGITA